jgi:hypothetical protein
VRVEELPLAAPRPVRVLAGRRFDEVLADAAAETPEERGAYVLVRVTDAEPIEAALARLRASTRGRCSSRRRRRPPTPRRGWTATSTPSTRAR